MATIDFTPSAPAIDFTPAKPAAAPEPMSRENAEKMLYLYDEQPPKIDFAPSAPAAAPVTTPSTPAPAATPIAFTPSTPAAAPTEGVGAELKRRVSDSAVKNLGDITNQIQKPFQPDNTAGPPWLQRIGDVGGRIGSAAADVVGAITSPLEGTIKTGVNRVIPDQIQGDKREQLVQDIGDVGTLAVLAPRAIGEAGNIAKAADLARSDKPAAEVANAGELVAKGPPPLDRKQIDIKMAELEKHFDEQTRAGTNPDRPAFESQMNDLADQWLHPRPAEPVTMKEMRPDLNISGPEKSTWANSVRNIASPTSGGEGAKNMETNIRSAQGLANRNVAVAEANLNKSSKLASSMTPEQRADYYNYMEGRSEGATLQDPALKSFADDTRQVMQDTRKEIETLPEGEKMGFFEDYFPHMWKNPDQAKQFVTGFTGKQGSSASLKKRELPTIQDGINAGLELAEPNPIKAASKYVSSMNNYIASKRIVDEARRVGDASYFTPGKQPEGWVPLTGRFAQKPGRHFINEGQAEAFAPAKQLYAPQDVARVYNNYYSKGFEATDLAHPFEAMRTATAANTGAELALSAYHASTITAQSIFNDLSRVFKNAAVGDWEGVGKSVKQATIGQLSGLKGSTYNIGSKAIDQYKNLEDHGLNVESIVDHFTKGGGKVGQERLYRGSELGGFVQAAKRGELKEVGQKLKDTASTGPVGVSKAALEVLGRATEDVAYPLFEHYIPRIKMGSFYNLMSDWIRQNPLASEVQIANARKHYVDLVDDRFGEMNMDNIFWPKLQKQIASLFLRAQGWDIGLVRQAGGGVLDTARVIKDMTTGKGFDKKLLDRPAFLAAAITGTGLINAAYQYMKTGEAPNEMLDYMMPKTGGVTNSGAPERVALPGHGKELIHMMTPHPGEGPLSGISSEAYNKMATFPKNLMEAWQNKDFRGDPIGETSGPGGWLGSVGPRVGHVAGGFAPFALGDQGDKREGSNLNPVERRLFGMRPAGMQFTDSDALHNIVEKKARKEWRNKMRHDARRENQKVAE